MNQIKLWIAGYFRPHAAPAVRASPREGDTTDEAVKQRFSADVTKMQARVAYIAAQAAVISETVPAKGPD